MSNATSQSTVLSPDEFLQTLEASNLVTPDQLSGVRAKITAETSTQTIAKALVQQGWVTLWQARQLAAGNSRMTLGKYLLLEQVGKGGMGAVYKAVHALTERTVALKVMARALVDKPDSVQRFLREVKTASALTHPNIVAAFDADEVDGNYFLVMEFVDGKDLGAWIKEHGALPIDWSCECIRQAACGLQHAYEQGMVHRDIKPSNLLVLGGSGDQMPEVKILDMGLARLSQAQEKDEGDITQSGQILGTPDYIAPEQARDSKSADIRADLFSLGCTLYKMLTGQVPFPGENVVEKLIARATTAAPSVRVLRPEVSEQLDGILARLMATDPDARFSTPQEVVDALKPHAKGAKPAPRRAPSRGIGTAELDTPNPDGEETRFDFGAGGNAASAAPAPAPARAAASQEETEEGGIPWLWIGVGGGVAALAVVLLLVFALSGGGPDPETLAEGTKESSSNGSSSDGSSSNETPAARETPSSKPPQRGSGQPTPAIPRRPPTVEDSDPPSRRGANTTPAPTDPPTPEPVPAIPPTPAVQPPEPATPEPGGVPNNPTPVTTPNPDTTPNPVDTTPAITRETVTVTGAKVFTNHQAPVQAIDFSPDGRTFASAGRDNEILIQTINSGEVVHRLTGHEDWVTALRYSPRGDWLLSGSWDNTARLWSPRDGRPHRHLHQNLGPVVRVGWGLDDSRCLTGDWVGNACTWNTNDGSQIRAVTSTGGAAMGVAMSGDQMVVGDWAENVVLWDTEGREVRRFEGHTDRVMAVVALPDAKQILTAGHDGTIRLWDVDSGAEVRQFGEPGLAVQCLDVSADGKFLVSGGRDNLVRVWEIETGAAWAELIGHSGAVWDVSFSPDGGYLLSASHDQSVRLWTMPD